MRNTLIAAAASASAAIGPAQADVIYDFIPDATPGFSLAAQVVISDEAVARGSFRLAGGGNNGFGQLVGDTADFRSLRVRVVGSPPAIGGPPEATDVYTAGVVPRFPFFGTLPAFALAFTFDPEGDVTSSVFYTGGTEEALRLTGDATASGTLSTDFEPCATQIPCTVTGAWSPPKVVASVPEPASALLLGGGVAFAAWRRRHA